MRNTFIKKLYSLAQIDNSLFLLIGDLGYGIVDKFSQDFPKQFFNAGISEQNMTSVATGMALEGKKIFTYSIANFPTLRCLEQIRNDCAYHEANVKIVSIGAGFAYGSGGMSHHATEDIAIMRALPNVTVFSPADSFETDRVTQLAYETKGTCYLRLGKGGEANIHNETQQFTVGEAIKVIEGNEICVFSTGAIITEAKKAVEKLNEIGISTSLYSFPTIKPIDVELIRKCKKKYRYIITVEEHNIVGGFGSAVSEVLAEEPFGDGVLKRIGINDKYSSIVGDQVFLREYFGISSEKIIEAVMRVSL